MGKAESEDRMIDNFILLGGWILLLTIGGLIGWLADAIIKGVVRLWHYLEKISSC